MKTASSPRMNQPPGKEDKPRDWLVTEFYELPENPKGRQKTLRKKSNPLNREDKPGNPVFNYAARSAKVTKGETVVLPSSSVNASFHKLCPSWRSITRSADSSVSK